jgi:hypothetical protein
MKKFLLTFFLSTLGSLIGNVLYALSLGTVNEYHWGRAVFFGIFFGIVVFFWGRWKKE